MPPNLDIPRTSLSAEVNFRSEKVLGLFFGTACVLDPEGTIQAVSENWDDLMGRTSRTDLLRNAVLGSAFLDLLPSDDETRAAFCFALASLAEGKQKQLVQHVEYGTPTKPSAISYVIHALREEDHHTGYLVQAMDATHETVIRMALLDRERRGRDLKVACDRQADEIAALKRRLDARISEHDKTVLGLLRTFQHSPGGFGSELCRLGVEATGAMFAALVVLSPEDHQFHFRALHNAPDFHRAAMNTDMLTLAPGEGPAGIAAQNGCATKFDHLLERPDFVQWATLAEQWGYNCIWALPLENEDGLYGALQLYFPEEDKPLTVDQYCTLSTLCQCAVPLLRAAEHWPTLQEIPTAPVHDEPKPEGFRMLAAGLSEEFSNLLTGVLGHSSLAAAEMGDSHAALNDIHAIERAARNAARLTRRLTAICGNARRGMSSLELGHFMLHYTQQDRAGFFPNGPAEVQVPEQTCPVHVDAASLEVMLDGISEHARMAMSGETPVWTLTTLDSSAVLTLNYTGAASQPVGWDDGVLPVHANQTPELFFAREAARTLGGDLTLSDDGENTEVTLTLPIARAVVQA